MIWRRMLVPESVTLRELYGILQVGMGWDGIHLYYFDIHAVRYGSVELHVENPDMPLSRFRFRANDRFAYLYDMDDYWDHEVRIGKFLDQNPKKTYPVCTSVSGVCPPEDCVGPAGYREWQQEATGYDAWSDLDLVAGFAAEASKSGVGSLTENDREAIYDSFERMAARAPFLDTTFSRRTVNDAFRAGRHLQMMHQQLI